jgi:chemotaxis protein methyltransferase CheR
MTEPLSATLLDELRRIVADQTGLHFPRERRVDLERGLRSAAPKMGFPDFESCARRLLSAPLTRQETEILAGELTVGETYFFREKRSFEILSEQILPEIVKLRQNTERRLRIWSAGCCTGEEPYTIAIFLDRNFPELKQWQVTILGTDINPLFLKKAAAGVYSEWSFRDSPPWLKERYFRQTGAHQYEILPAIKEKVRFSYLNLAEDSYPSLATNTNAMDLIFCRNVLMYFGRQTARFAIQNFHRSLVGNGWLIVSATETSSELFAPLGSVQFDGMTLYRKGESASFATPLPSPRFEPASALPSLPDFKIETPAPLPEPAAEIPVPGPYDNARTFFDEGNYEKAARVLDATADTVPATPEIAALRARICANLGDLDQARSWVEKALSTDKLNAELHYLSAVILEEQGVTEEAFAALKRTLYLDPNFVLAHFALGNQALREKKFKDAEKHFANTRTLLDAYQPGDVLPQSDGMVAGRLREIVESAMAIETGA